MVQRSLLYCPGDEPDMMENAIETNADTIIFDLEDAIDPNSKETAREEVKDFLGQVGDTGKNISVRINQYDRLGAADVEAITASDNFLPDSIVLPMASDTETIEKLNNHLKENGAEETTIIPLIETATGLINSEALANCQNISAIAYGDQDFTADIGATVTGEKTESLYARQRIVVAAAAANIDAIDTVETDISDIEGLRNQTQFVVDIGFKGKLAIHPDQIDIINQSFTPSEEQIEWAEKVLEGKKSAQEQKKGVYTVDGQMIDPPLIERAKKIQERAKAAGEM